MRNILALMTVLSVATVPAISFAASDQPDAAASQMAPIPDGTINKAGAALHDIAKLQDKYKGSIQAASPEQKQSISDRANSEAVQAIQSHGLSVQEYSSVVHTAQADPNVRQRLLKAANQPQ